MKFHQDKQFSCQTGKNNSFFLLLLATYIFFLVPLYSANAQEVPEQEKPIKATGIIGAEIAPLNPQTEKLDVFYYEINPGNSLDDKFLLGNTSDKINTVHIYPTYGTSNEKGEITHSMEYDEKKELSQWIKIEETDFTLNPKEIKKVNMKIEIPENTPLGTYKGGFAIQKTGKPNEQGITAAFRKIIKIEINITNDPKEFVEKKTPSFQLTPIFYLTLLFFVLSTIYYFSSISKQKKRNKK
ncbi:DUF916 domain-containing protein [Patescibacteria group bacterium]|nr:DUF916 domain-containing protein [Patescibacteria group bacterium]